MTTARNVVNLALIGFMGAGKSSVGRLVAEQLRFDFLDTDELIETRAGHGAGKPTSKTIEEYADIYAFLAKTLKVDVK